MSYRSPRSEGHGAGRGRPAPARSAGRTPPANAGRVTASRGYDAPRSSQRPAPRTSDARWQPLPADPPRSRQPRTERPERPRRTGGKVFLALLSTLVLVTTGYYWSQFDKWSKGMTTADVINTEPTEKPADGAIDILMVGMDSRTDAQGNPLSEEQLAMLSAGESDGALNTDTLIMIRIPNDGGAAVGVSMPRDSFVDIPGYDKHKINSAYLRARNNAWQRLEGEGVTDQAELNVRSNEEGAKKLIETVEELTGAGIDRYAEVNLLGFYDITNAIGGIDVCLKAPVDDWRSGANFPAGPQTLAGTNALAFVRQRHGLPNGDLDRIVRQQVFMSGMAKKVFSQDMLTPGSDTLENLRLAVQKSVVLSKDWNVIEFAQEMMGFTGGKMEFKTIPVGSISLETPEDGDAVEVDPAEVKEFVQGLIGQAPPAEGGGDGGDGGGDSGSVDNGDIHVNVRNASGQAGLAASVASALTDQGFGEGEVGNAEGRASTVVRFAAGEQDSGDRVAAAIGGNPLVEEDENLPTGTVTVLLGQDYDSPSGDSAESDSDGAGESGDSLAGNRPLVLSGQPPVGARAAQPDAAGCVN